MTLGQRTSPLVSQLLRLCLLIFVMATVSDVNAQTETTGSIIGTVTSSTDRSPIANAVVQITNLDTSLSYRKITKSNGEFRQTLLPSANYTVKVTAPGYKDQEQVVLVVITRANRVFPLPVVMEPLSATVVTPAPVPTSPQPASPPVTIPDPTPTPPIVQTEARTPSEEVDVRETINRDDGRRGGSFAEKQVLSLPLGSITKVRTFDELALLLPGVTLPPQTLGGVAGPGVGPGVGTAGQFSVNGLRSRGNNFTIDGSDNNDADIGVRRQGFLALIPQPIESIQEYQVITLLAPAQYGRNFGAQVNAVSKSGGNATHGTFYGFFNSSQLNAREYFDTSSGNGVTTLQANGQNVSLRTFDQNNSFIMQPFTVRNGSGGKDSSTLAQAGFVLGGPLVPSDTDHPGRSLFYFISVEGQLLNASQEANFAVPTLPQRGVFNSATTGLFKSPDEEPLRAYSQTVNGDAIFSLFPFPNNPGGIYGQHTFTQTLPAGGEGKVLSGKVDGNFLVRGMQQSVTARYNFTDDFRTIPVTGEAIFSSLRPRVRTQNFSTFLNSQISDRLSNQLRASYGRTKLVFGEQRDTEFSLPSETNYQNPTENQFLLNAPFISNVTIPPSLGIPFQGGVVFERYPFSQGFRSFQEVLGPVGQIQIAGFSSIGVDVFNFPQRRVNNMYQLADTLTVTTGSHSLAFGADIRRIELNSDLPRNSRPLLIFNSNPALSAHLGGLSFLPIDLASAGAPTGALQTLTLGGSAINLRLYEYNFFGQDEWRITPSFSLSYGLRYEYTTPPREVNRRIESTFNDPIVFSQLPELQSFVGGRTSIFESERKNFAPRVGFAYARDLFESGRTTVVRGGYGIFYDRVLGAVVSQSRNVFPSFLTLNFGGGQVASSGFLFDLFNPARDGLRFRDTGRFVPFVTSGTLNQPNPELGSREEFINAIKAFFPIAGFGVTLPTKRLKTPMAHQYSFTIEQTLSRNTVLSVAYVGTLGRHLLRLNTPNLGENVVPVPLDLTQNSIFPEIIGFSVPPRPSPSEMARPSGGSLGAVNLIETSANSRYDAGQVQLRSRFSNLQYQTGYTFGKVLDYSSDFFDLAGALALPQDSERLDLEYGPANFDVRHRFSYSATYDLPALRDQGRVFRALFGGLQLAGTGQFQTGQPFTVNTIYDVNGDGNFTDRPNTTNGIVTTGDRSQPLRLTVDPSELLAGPFEDGAVGRNTFRTGNLLLLNAALSKRFAITERQDIIFRAEVFNLTNHDNFGVPVRFLEFPSFGRATNTVTPGRRVQFALKYSF